jgi:hypothetical protein
MVPAQFFYSLNNSKKGLYTNVPEIIAFNLKTSIHKYSISSSWYNFFNTNVSDFTRILLLQVKHFWALISLRKIKLC